MCVFSAVVSVWLLADYHGEKTKKLKTRPVLPLLHYLWRTEGAHRHTGLSVVLGHNGHTGTNGVSGVLTIIVWMPLKAEPVSP